MLVGFIIFVGLIIFKAMSSRWLHASNHHALNVLNDRNTMNEESFTKHYEALCLILKVVKLFSYFFKRWIKQVTSKLGMNIFCKYINHTSITLSIIYIEVRLKTRYKQSNKCTSWRWTINDFSSRKQSCFRKIFQRCFAFLLTLY